MSEPRPVGDLLPALLVLLRLAQRRRGWAVVLYTSDECEEHPGLMCAMEVVYRPGMTSREAKQVQGLVLPGFAPHVVAVSDPAMWEVPGADPAGEQG